jgi:hypothetical protein
MRERTLEQRLGLREHVLVEIDAAEIVQRSGEVEIDARSTLLQRRDRRLQDSLGVRKAADVAIEVAELRFQDAGHLVVGTQARLRQLDGFFRKPDRSRLVAGEPELLDSVVQGREFGLRGSVGHRKEKDRDQNERDEAENAKSKCPNQNRGAHRNLEIFKSKISALFQLLLFHSVMVMMSGLWP